MQGNGRGGAREVIEGRRGNRARRRWVRWVAAVLVVLVAGSGAFFRFLFLGNFRVVEDGRLFRSAQPHGTTAARLIESYRPASILNLRGGSPSDPWYAAEVRAAEEGHVDFYDFPLSAVRRPSRRDLLTLLDVLKTCKYPLLVHCKSGSDRTGLAVALYLLARRGAAPRDAEAGGFSIWCGHVPLFGPEHLHEPIAEYDAWLSSRGLPHSPERFRAWVEREYRDDDPRTVAPLPVRPGPRRRAQTASTTAGSSSNVSTTSDATSQASGTPSRSASALR
jgi:protein tyrosine phosphatase (PTP) superfamily phosphohydrolase (DUF442 family)